MSEYYTNPKVTRQNMVTEKRFHKTEGDDDEGSLKKRNSTLEDLTDSKGNDEDIALFIDEIERLQRNQYRFGYAIDVKNQGYSNFQRYVSEMNNPTPPYLPRNQVYNAPDTSIEGGVAFSLAVLGLYFLGKIGRKKDN